MKSEKRKRNERETTNKYKKMNSQYKKMAKSKHKKHMLRPIVMQKCMINAFCVDLNGTKKKKNEIITCRRLWIHFLSDRSVFVAFTFLPAKIKKKERKKKKLQQNKKWREKYKFIYVLNVDFELPMNAEWVEWFYALRVKETQSIPMNSPVVAFHFAVLKALHQHVNINQRTRKSILFLFSLSFFHFSSRPKPHNASVLAYVQAVHVRIFIALCLLSVHSKWNGVTEPMYSYFYFLVSLFGWSHMRGTHSSASMTFDFSLDE